LKHFCCFSISIDGGWGPFGDWSECSSACGGGYRFRQRKCDDPVPENGGLPCLGCNIEYELCNKQPCIEVKKLGPFTQWLIVNNSDVGYMEKRFRYQCKATGNFLIHL
jgi:chondroitin sulfate proteoglycan 4